MRATLHAARRAVERDVTAREIILTRNRPERIWRTRKSIVRTRNGVVVVTDLTDTDVLTVYRTA